MKEAYCSYEISELLKKKGFDNFLPFGFNSTWHTPKPRKFIEDDGRGGFYDNKEDWISCPTHQMTCAWLREKGIHITTIHGYHLTNKKVFWIPKIDSLKLERFDLPDNFYQEYDSLEDAVNAALKYALENLI